MSVTNHIGLRLTAASETSMTFLEWRTLMNGVDVDSNMELIDAAIGELISGVNGKADGFTFNPETGLLQLTNNGIGLPNASVLIDITDFYTKDEVDTMISDAQRAASVGTVEWDETSRQLQLYNGNGDPIGDPITIEGGGSGPSSYTYSISLQNTLDSRDIKVAEGSSVMLGFRYVTADESGNDDGNGVGTIMVNNVRKGSFTVTQGENTVDIKNYVSAGTNTVKLRVENSEGSYKTITYTVTVVALSLTTTFTPLAIYTGDVLFSYTPIGAGEKTIHFLMDGVQFGTETVTSTGRSRSYVVPAQTHGGHTLEVYATATDGDVTIRSNTLTIGMLFVSSSSTVPAIASSFAVSESVQGDILSIPYMVYVPGNEMAEITLSVLNPDATVYSTTSITVGRTVQTWNVQDYPAGNVTFRIACGSAALDLPVSVTEYILPVEPITDGLTIEFDPSGRSNGEANPAQWAYENISATFTGFGWNNSDGWLSDDDGAAILRFMPNESMSIPFKPFASDARETGYTIEVEFATRNVRDYESIVFDCLSGGRGVQITSQEAMLKSEQSSVSMLFKEDSRVRVAFVIEQRNLNRLIYIYINGVMCGVRQYPASDNFAQATPVGLTIGSTTCGIDLYHIRCYSKGLTRNEQLDNYIVDRSTLVERQNASARNNILNELDEVTSNKLPTSLPYMVIESDALPVDKNADDITGCTVTFTDREDPARSFVATNVNMSVQGTSSAGYPVKNFKIKMLKATGSTLVVNGTAVTDGYALKNGEIPVKTFCLKADYASSEGANNVELVDLYNEICPYRTPPQEDNAAVRQGIAGRPMAVFWHNRATNEVTFVGKYNFNNDKSTSKTYGFDYDTYPNAQSWEFLDNSVDLCLFKTGNMTGWKNAFEAREPDGNEDVTRLTRVVQWVASTRTDAATNAALSAPVTYDGTTYSTDTAAYRLAKFKAEFENYFIKDSALFYYIFTEVFLMVDSRAKNMFLTTYDGTHWLFLPYDMDTAIGINNEGELVFDYNLEDTDTYNGGVVFNGQDSVLWNNVRVCFPNEIREMYNTLRSVVNSKFSYGYVKDAFERHQSVWPEALWNEDAFVKYLQPFLLNGINNLAMLQGSKESQRDWWLFNGFRYRDSKYQSGDANTYIQLRAFEKDSITITPYSHIYAKVEFGNERIAIERAEKGVPVTLSDPSSDPWAAGTDTVVRIYSADRLSSVGDLSGLNAGTADFSAAVKLEELKLGDGASDYENTHLSSLTVGRNELLTMLDIRKCVNLTQTIDLSGCPSLEEVKAGGSSITGVIVSDGGHLNTLTLPNTITNLTIQNQSMFETLNVAGYGNLQTLRIENTPNVPIETIVTGATNLERVRLVGVNWTATNATTLQSVIDKLETCIGMDASGNNTDHAVVTGRVSVPSISSELLTEINENFPQLVVVVNNVPQYVVRYLNYDNTVIYRAVVAEGGDAVNPVTAGTIEAPTRPGTDTEYYTFVDFGTLPTNVRNNESVVAQYEITYRVRYMADNTVLQTKWVTSGGNATYTGSTPTKTSTAQYSYTFSGWEGTQTNITSARDIIAQFTSTVRKYTVTFVNNSSGSNVTLQTVQNVSYGASASYTGSTPVNATDSTLAFLGWNPAPTNIQGDTTCVAQFEPPVVVEEITDSWDTIIANIENGTYATKYKLGNYKPLDLGSEGIVNMQIVGMDVDNLTSGNGQAPLTFISKELLETDHRMNRPKSSNNREGTGAIGGWEKCEMRSYLNNTIKPLIPVNVRTAMVSVHKSQPAFDTTGEQFTQTTSDDVWIPSYDEMFSSSGSTNQPRYRAVFPDNTSRAKVEVGSTNTYSWWLRSAYTTGWFHLIGPSGGFNYSYADYREGVALGFCLGNTKLIDDD